jgi:hypothetical protein
MGHIVETLGSLDDKPDRDDVTLVMLEWQAAESEPASPSLPAG